MRLYEVRCGLLPIEGIACWYVIAENERVAWLYGYHKTLRDPLYDSGTIDAVRVKDFSKVVGVKPVVIK